MRRNRVIFYLAWILSLVGISFYGGVVSYGVFCALTLLPAVMYVYLLFVLFSFKIYQQLEAKYVVCRTPVTYYFTLQNETAFAFSRIRVSFFEFGADYGELDKDEEYELMPHSGTRITTSIICRYRGEYEIGVRSVVITDFLNMFRITYRKPETLKVNVFPAIVFPNGDMLEDEPLFAAMTSHNAPEVRDLLVRPYADGDPVRSINWKASARSLSLMTSKMTSEEHSSVHILLDTARYSSEPEKYLPAEDEVLTRLITLVIYLATHHISADVYYLSRGLQHLTLRSMREFEDFYACISAVMFSTGVDVNELRLDLLRSGNVSEEDMIVLSSQRPGTEVEK